MGTINALFSYFLDYTFWKGSIFQKWLPFLADTLCKIYFKETYKLTKDMDPESKMFEREQLATKCFLYKVLGGCPVCTNIWIGFISWSAILFFTDIFQWYYGIVYLMVSSAVLRKFVGATY